MILAALNTEMVRHLNVGSAAQLRSRLIEFMQNERMRLMKRCAEEQMGENLSRAQGAYSALLELETLLTATPAKIQHENENEVTPPQFPGGPKEARPPPG